MPKQPVETPKAEYLPPIDEGRGSGKRFSIEATFRSMPPPSELKEYNKIHKGFGSKMLKDTLEEKRHQRAMEKKMVNTFQWDVRNGKYLFVFTLLLTAVVVVAFMFWGDRMPEYVVYTIGAVVVALIFRGVLPAAFNALGKGFSAISSKGGKR